jgi:major membrane immunogen (membrane-anchored lipoprotein)
MFLDDVIPPVTTIEIGEPHIVIVGNTHLTSDTHITLTAEDGPDGSGIASTSYRIFNAESDSGWIDYDGSFDLTCLSLSDGTYTLEFYSTDNAGNDELTNSMIIILDNSLPVTTIEIGEPHLVIDGNTHLTSDTLIVLAAGDDIGGSGIASTSYRIFSAVPDNGWIVYGEPFSLSDLSLSDGAYTLEFYSTDNLGNDELANSMAIVLDNSPPVTTIEIGELHAVIDGNTHLTSDTLITLTVGDDPGGSGIASSSYRIFNAESDSGWIDYDESFDLTDLSLSDGTYTLEYYSTDNLGNYEMTNSMTIILDNSPPSIKVLSPEEWSALQDSVTFIIQATDPSGINGVDISIRDPDGDPAFEMMPAFHAGGDEWHLTFDTTLLPDGYYLVIVEAADNFGFAGSTIVSYSIRNWVTLELLPATEANKAGRTMPVKFSLRVVETVDPTMPFVWNEELTIIIRDKNNPNKILHVSTFGDASKDYRIDGVSEHYITNFKTAKKLTSYVVEIWRKDMFIDSFEFSTDK